MKKKFVLALILVLTLTICVLGFTACQKNDFPNHKHNYRVTVIEPTCTEQGYTLHKCSCGDEYSDETVAPLDHNYVDNVCTVCGDEKPTEETGLEYTLSDDGSYYIVSGLGTETRAEFMIPSMHKGKPVKEIGASAFACIDQEGTANELNSIKEVIIPDSITSIGEGAFASCTGLTSITIPNSVTSIADRVFYYCSGLTSITIPNSVTSIGSSAFSNSGLDSVTIPDSVTSIGDYAFAWCSGLDSITIPDSVTAIGYDAFYECNNLQYNEYDNAYYLGNDNNPYVILVKRTNTSITSCIINDKTKVIYQGAFRDCSRLTSITIPDSVISIGEYAFDGCPIETATIPTIAIPYIKNDKLKTVVITSGASIGDDAFRYCEKLTSITIGNSVTSIDGDVFRRCYKLVEVINKSQLNITKGSSSNGSVAYYALNVKTEGTSDIVKVNDYLFYTYNNVNYLVDYVGNDTELVLPDNYNGQNYVINQYAFYNCRGLTSVTIPDSVTSIGENAFYWCSGLTSVTIGNSVTSIGEYAFSGCHKLVEVINKSKLNITKGSSSNGDVGYYAVSVKTVGTSNIVKVNDYLFYTYDNVNYLVDYVGNDTELVLPDNYNGQNYIINQYAFYNCSKLTSITIPDSVTSIGGSAFEDCRGLTSITIGNSVTSIGYRAFSGCSGLESITIPDSVTSIEDSAFYGCNNLKYNEYDNAYYLGNDNNPYVVLVKAKNTSITSCTINDKTKFIHSTAFRDCSGLESITTPDSVTSIGGEAFYNCSGLESVTIGNSLTSIGNYVFRDCNNLKYNEYDNAYYLGNDNNPYIVLVKAKDTSIISCSVNDNTKVIANGAFWDCKKLTSITIGNSVTSIGDSAFNGCKSLTSVTIPDSVISIDSYAFYNCSSLKSVTIPNSVTSIGDSAFA